MHNRPGIAIVDYHTTDRNLYGRVVSAFAFPRGTYYGPRTLSVILDLPAGIAHAADDGFRRSHASGVAGQRARSS